MWMAKSNGNSIGTERRLVRRIILFRTILDCSTSNDSQLEFDILVLVALRQKWWSPLMLSINYAKMQQTNCGLQFETDQPDPMHVRFI